jgi:hypothetical protein
MLAIHFSWLTTGCQPFLAVSQQGCTSDICISHAISWQHKVSRRPEFHNNANTRHLHSTHQHRISPCASRLHFVSSSTMADDAEIMRSHHPLHGMVICCTSIAIGLRVRSPPFYAHPRSQHKLTAPAARLRSRGKPKRWALATS